MQTAQTSLAKADAFRAMLAVSADVHERRQLRRRLARAVRDAADHEAMVALRQMRRQRLEASYALAYA